MQGRAWIAGVFFYLAGIFYQRWARKSVNFRAPGWLRLFCVGAHPRTLNVRGTALQLLGYWWIGLYIVGQGSAVSKTNILGLAGLGVFATAAAYVVGDTIAIVREERARKARKHG